MLKDSLEMNSKCSKHVFSSTQKIIKYVHVSDMYFVWESNSNYLPAILSYIFIFSIKVFPNNNLSVENQNNTKNRSRNNGHK